MAIKPLSIPSKRLTQSITSASSSIVVNNIEGWDGDDLVAGDFGARAFAALMNTTKTQLEFVEIDPTTIASASITLLKRGLSFDGDRTTETAALKLDWAAYETIVMFGTDIPQLLAQYIDDTSDQTIGGVKSFTSVPNTSADPVDDNDLARRSWILNNLPAGAVSINATIESAIAGETVAAGNLLYFSETDNEWLKCDADTLATVMNVKLGIAQGAGVNGGAISGGVLTRGLYTTSGLTQGDLCYASNTAGGINSGTPGTVPRVIGIAKDSTHLYFDPDFQNKLYDYAVDAVGTDSYAITLPGALSVPFTGMKVTFKAGTANTGACTLAINGGSAKDIKKNYNEALVTGDIIANQICIVIYDGTNFQLLSKTPTLAPTVQTFSAASTSLGDSTTQFDITNPAGSTFRYTYDGTGTDPLITALTIPIGSRILIMSPNMEDVNVGSFTVTGSGANYFEVTNASGNPANNVTIGSNGYLKLITPQTYTRPANLKYAIVEVQAAGGAGGLAASDGNVGGGGGGGEYARKIVSAATIGSTQTVYVGPGGKGNVKNTDSVSSDGASASFGSILSAKGGDGGGANANIGSGGNGGTGGSGGDIQIQGGDGAAGYGKSVTPDLSIGGIGGSSQLGGGGANGSAKGAEDDAGTIGKGYGSGGGGAACQSAGANGGDGADGIIIVTEYY